MPFGFPPERAFSFTGIPSPDVKREIQPAGFDKVRGNGLHPARFAEQILPHVLGELP